MKGKGRMVSLFFTLFVIVFQLKSQHKYPQDYFRSPLDIPLYLSGNFAEIRSNHFHSGIDIKTQGKEGFKVFAIANGYISRIKIQSGGYGRALYITHPNGYTSVYGHLKVFNDKIEKYIKDVQYKRREHSVDVYPRNDMFPVRKGDVIALSGNSGRSSGPHLHFEIRDAATEFPLNVLLFNFNIKDNINPFINTLVIYPINYNSLVNNANKATRMNLINKNNTYSIENSTIIELKGEIGFGIEAIDYLNGVNNKCGVYSIDLFIDEILIYAYELEKFSFYESRYINSFIDYKEKQTNNRKIQKLFIDPNNKLSIYKTKGNGIYNFNDNDTHHIKIVVKDVYKNTSMLKFPIISSTKYHMIIPEKDTNFTKTFHYNSTNAFAQHDIELLFPLNCFYTNINFNYAKTMPNEGCYSWIHYIHNKLTPVHKNFIIKIKPDSIPEKHQNKACIAKLSDNNGFIYVGGEWDGDFIKARSRSFGKYVVTIDTVAPVITPINISKNTDMSVHPAIQINITDNLSGIKRYNGYIDGKWVLFEYDSKKNLLIYEFDKERLVSGSTHKLSLIITDYCNNTAKYKTSFKW